MVEYIWHEGPVPKNMRVTQVAGILFNDEGKILVKKDADGVYGLAGGTPEAGETREETLHREVDEEVNCKIADLEYIGYQVVHGDGEPYAQLRYIARVTYFGPNRPDLDNGKIYERSFVPAKDANKYLKYGPTGDKIIEAAIKAHNKNMSYLILHGSFGSKDGNWFPWLAAKLEESGAKVTVPQMPIGVGGQNFDSWSAVLDGLKIDGNTVIIAHSIAPAFVCKYLVAKKLHVAKLFFVCGFNNYTGIDPDYDAVNTPMFSDNFAEVKNYCNSITCFYSDNDPYVDFASEKAFADQLTDHQIIIPNAGHLNAETGYTAFPQLFAEII